MGSLSLVERLSPSWDGPFVPCREVVPSQDGPFVPCREVALLRMGSLVGTGLLSLVEMLG